MVIFYDKYLYTKIQIFRFKENPQWRETLATCLNLSMCGNFVFIGYNSGHVDKFNIQSGIHRGEWALRITYCIIYKNLILNKSNLFN